MAATITCRSGDACAADARNYLNKLYQFLEAKVKYQGDHLSVQREQQKNHILPQFDQQILKAEDGEAPVEGAILKAGGCCDANVLLRNKPPTATTKPGTSLGALKATRTKWQERVLIKNVPLPIPKATAPLPRQAWATPPCSTYQANPQLDVKISKRALKAGRGQFAKDLNKEKAAKAAVEKGKAHADGHVGRTSKPMANSPEDDDGWETGCPEWVDEAMNAPCVARYLPPAPKTPPPAPPLSQAMKAPRTARHVPAAPKLPPPAPPLSQDEDGWENGCPEWGDEAHSHYATLQGLTAYVQRVLADSADKHARQLQALKDAHDNASASAFCVRRCAIVRGDHWSEPTVFPTWPRAQSLAASVVHSRGLVQL